jgi:hypothetical protein
MKLMNNSENANYIKNTPHNYITSSVIGRFSSVFPYLNAGKIRQRLAYVIGGFQTEAAF